MKEKTTIRYISFRSAMDGGRIFDFSVSTADQSNLLISVAIPNQFFEGAQRIPLQDGVGICYERLKHLFEMTAPSEAPSLLRLTSADLALHRQAIQPGEKRKYGFQPSK